MGLSIEFMLWWCFYGEKWNFWGTLSRENIWIDKVYIDLIVQITHANFTELRTELSTCEWEIATSLQITLVLKNHSPQLNKVRQNNNIF